MNENAEAFYQKVNKYGGWQPVPTQTIYSIFEQILKPSQMGFEPAKRGWWTRAVSKDIAHVIKIDALKGRGYGLSYGLSLSYIPYPYHPKIRWHKTAKFVMLHLREQPQVHLQDPLRRKSEAELCVVNTMLGETCLRNELELGWGFCSPKIRRWFETTSTLTGILERCQEHLSRNSKGEVQYLPDARLVRVFTCAKLGRSEASAELENFLIENKEPEDARSNLRSALSVVFAT